SDAATDTERDLAVQDRLMIRELKEVELARHRELLAEGLRSHPDPSGHELVTAPGNGVPREDVPVEAMHGAPILRAGLRDPVIVVGGAHLVREPILERPADPDQEHRWMLLQDRGLALLAREV